jgi:hypothetical protein
MPPNAGGTDPRAFAARFRDRQAALVQRLRAEPDVANLTFLLGLPDNERNALLDIEGREGVYQTGTGRIGADLEQIDVDALEPFDIQVLAGRAFDSRDIAGDARPVIVNHTFARRVIGGDNAVGQRIRERQSSSGPGPWLEIVGVISDFLTCGWTAAALLTVFSYKLLEAASAAARGRHNC